jgi:hypothetical protein
MAMSVPTLETYLPELVQFTKGLAEDCREGRLNNWPLFAEKSKAFYDPTCMDKIEQVAPGWGQMSSYASQRTLIHVTSVLTALHLLPEYQQMSRDQRAIMEWVVLFHDIAKEVHPGKHDYIHGFRSAAIAGKSLAHLGFPATDAYPQQIDTWFNLTYNAVRYDETRKETIQDNDRLPQIITGIHELFGVDSLARLVILPILFHLSIVTDPDYPTLAPLTIAEIRSYVDEELYPLLKAMMLVDTDGWCLFDAIDKARHREQTLEGFKWIKSLLQPNNG